MNQKPKNKKVMILIYFLVVMIPMIWFFFLNTGSDHSKAEEILAGKWQRADGPYTIQIMEIRKDGVLEVAYLNPNPMSGVTGNWKMKNKKLSIFIKIADVSYQGSTYQLKFNDHSGNLFGLYYQAIAKQTFDVSFTKLSK